MDLSTLVQALRGLSPELMEALEPETLRALAGVAPEVLRSLKEVPVEVVEALRPEVVAALANLPIEPPRRSEGGKSESGDLKMVALESAMHQLTEALEATSVGDVRVVGHFGAVDSEGQRYPWYS